MANKNARSSGKFTGNHTSLTAAASLVSDIAAKCESVYKISPGFLKAGLKSVRGKRRVKIINKGSCLLLAIRDNISQQEVHVYASDTHAAASAIADGAREAGLLVTFEDRMENNASLSAILS